MADPSQLGASVRPSGFSDLQNSQQFLTVSGSSWGRIRGLTCSNNVAFPNTRIDISAGAVRDSTNSYDIVLPVGITKRLDASWAVGSNNGGLDTGTLAANTCYHLHLIYRPSNGSVAVLFSASAYSPVLPSGYQASRRIWSILTDGSGNIRPFSQFNRHCFYKNPPLDVGVAAANTTPALLRNLSVPTGFKVLAKTLVQPQGTSGLLYVTDPDVGSPTTLGVPPGLSCLSWTNTALVELSVSTNASGQIYTLDSGTSSTINVWTKGWVDDRGEYE